MRVGGARRRLHLLPAVAAGVQAVQYVAGDGGAEQARVLAHHADLPPAVWSEQFYGDF